jgi:hypothetical protein
MQALGDEFHHPVLRISLRLLWTTPVADDVDDESHSDRGAPAFELSM